MTPEEIKKIAEEYAHSIFDVDKSDPNLNEKDWQEQFEMATNNMRELLEFLTARFYLVEKGEAAALQAEIHCAIMDAHNDDDMQMVAHEVLDVMPRRFAAVFGTDIRKEEEE